MVAAPWVGEIPLGPLTRRIPPLSVLTKSEFNVIAYSIMAFRVFLVLMSAD